MKRGTIRHEKIFRLAETLGVRRAEAVGILTALWELASDHYPNGDIGDILPAYFAEQCLWHGDGKVLTDALIACKLAEYPTCTTSKTPRSVLFIHDWHEHCETAVHNKIARAREWFANGKPPKLSGLSNSEKPTAAEFYRTHVRPPKKSRRNSADIAPSFPALALTLTNTSTLYPLPPEIDDPRLVVAWESWQDHRKETKHPIKPTTAKGQIRQMVEWGVERSVAAIEYSIRQGWQGMFEEGGKGGNGQAQGITIPAGQAVCDRVFGKKDKP